MTRIRGILKKKLSTVGRTQLQQLYSEQTCDSQVDDELVPSASCQAIIDNDPHSDIEDDGLPDATDGESSSDEEEVSDNDSVSSMDPDNIPPPEFRQESKCRKKPHSAKKSQSRKRKKVHKTQQQPAKKKVRFDVHEPSSSTPVSGSVTYQATTLPDGSLVFLCPHCPEKKRYKYKKENNLLKHVDLVHSGKLPQFPCDLCSDKFFYKRDLTKHKAQKKCHRKWDKKPRPMFHPGVTPGYKLGPAMDFSHLRPVEFFLWLFTNVIILWVSGTEKNGKIRFGRQWRTFRTPDAFRWIGLYICRGLLKSHRIKDPWKVHRLFNNDYFVDTMSCRRWYMIFRATSFVDKEYEQRPGGRGDLQNPLTYDRLWRVDDPVNAFVEASQKSWNPGLHLSIDEMMTKFKGWFKYKCTMPKKPIKEGIKAFVLTCGTSAFVLNWIPYVKRQFSKHEELGATASTVWALLIGENLKNGRSFLNLGHFIFTDSYYTMLSLIEYLLENLTYYCGTLAVCRQLPDKFTELVTHAGKKMTRGMVKFLHWGKITLSLWLDSKSVVIASSLPHIVDEMSSCKRIVYSSETDKWEKKEIPCPVVVEEYNKYMSGVDRVDQVLAAYHVHIRQQKWFMCIWFRLIEMAVINAHILYKYTFPGTRLANSMLDFQWAVIEGLTQLADRMDDPDAQREPFDIYFPDDEDHDLDRPIAPLTPLDLRSMRFYYKSAVGRRIMDKLRFNRNSAHTPHYATIRRRCVCCGGNYRTNICCSYCKVCLHPGRCYERFHKRVVFKY